MRWMVVILAAAVVPLVAGQHWQVGITTDAAWAYGATNARYAAIWPVDEPLNVTYFRDEHGALCGPNLYPNGFVCWRLSDNGEYAVVANYYLNWWNWCADGTCRFVDDGYPLGIDDEGDTYGMSAPVNGHAVMWCDDATRRFEFPAWKAIIDRTHDAVTFRTFRGAIVDIARQDWNADGRVNNFDIWPFVVSALTQTPAENTQTGTWFDAAALLRELGLE